MMLRAELPVQRNKTLKRRSVIKPLLEENAEVCPTLRLFSMCVSRVNTFLMDSLHGDHAGPLIFVATRFSQSQECRRRDEVLQVGGARRGGAGACCGVLSSRVCTDRPRQVFGHHSLPAECTCARGYRDRHERADG